MACGAELLFIDPSIRNLDTICCELRPAVETVVLNPNRQVGRQIAAALGDRRGLAAVHIIAHGAAGRVSFISDDWSLATLAQDAADLAAAATGRIGAADLGGTRDLMAFAQCARPRSPLTAAAMATYRGVMTARSWTNPGTSRNWNNSANWSPAGVPAVGDDVTIGARGQKLLTPPHNH